MFVITNNELERNWPLGDSVQCAKCGAEHQVQFGERVHADGTRTPDRTAVKVLQPKEGENPHNKIIVKCEYSQNKDDCFGVIKYFSPANLMPN